MELVLPTVPRSDIRPDGAIPSAFVDPIESFTKDGEIALLWTLKPSKKSANPAWLTIVLEPAAQGLSPQEFRAFALKKFAKGAYDIKHVEHNGIPLARYTTGSLAAGLYAAHGVSTLGAKDTARNLEAFLVGGETWARIKLTADSLGAEEERAFYSAVESARFVDTSNPATSFDYYSLGRSFSAKKDFARAAGYLASAITLEQNHAQLNAKHWRDLIMKSAEAYVTTSRLPAAAQVLEYGVTRDPTNETFQMQLARTYASMGDMAKTLATLKTTFQLMKKKKEIFEKTSFPGTTSHTMSLPDLNRDPAFKEMMKDKAFREAVKAFKN
ncbi:MAG TPA: hypothetical protein VIT19_08810 [Pyrinomonadaceae bacterium]